MLIRAIDDIVENCTLDNGLFYYKELPSLSRNGNNTLLLESLAIAYELTGDKKYLEYGFKTFETNIFFFGCFVFVFCCFCVKCN